MAETSDFKVLIIHSDSGRQLYMFSQMLYALDHAYNYIEVARILMTTRYGWGRWRDLDVYEPRGRFGRWVARRDRLVLKSVEIHSPGFWKIAGKIFSLEQIRLYLNDRHERKKDLQYRNQAEKEKLQIENQMLAVTVEKERLELASSAARQIDESRSRLLENKRKELALLKEYAETARSLGVGDQALEAVVQNFIIKPLEGLDSFQDAGLLTSASFEDENKQAQQDKKAETK